MVHLHQLHEKYSNRTQFLFVYIRDAGHPLPEEVGDIAEDPDAPAGSRLPLVPRVRAGRKHYDLRFPCLLDNEQEKVQALYRAFPKRLLLVDPAGHIVVDSGNVPYEPFPWKEVTDWLDRYEKSVPPRPATKPSLSIPAS